MKPVRLTTVAAVAVLLTAGALADDGRGREDRDNHGRGKNSVFESSVVGSVPSTAVAGVNSGGVPWVVSEGEASVSGKGKLHVEVEGLLIAAGPGVPANLVGTTGRVQMVAASLVCGGSGGTVAVTSDPTPLSSSGFADIEAKVTLPATCMAPVVLIRIFNPNTSQVGSFIALSGFNAGS